MLLGFGVALAALLLVGVTSYMATSRFQAAGRTALGNAEVLVALHNVSAGVVSAVSNQRAYLLTDNERFLERRQAAVAGLDSAIRQLRQQTLPDPALTARVDEIAQLLAARMAPLEQVLASRRAQGPESSRQLLDDEIGEEAAAMLHAAIDRLARERQALLRASVLQAERDGDRASWSYLLALSVSFLLLGVLMWLAWRQMRERQRIYLALLANSARLKAANEELKNFAYVASHDLKAPLRAIGSLADWISSDYAEKFDDEGREQMRLLIGRVRRMDGLIDGILEYSRVGRIEENATDVELDRLLAETVDLLAPPPHIQVIVEPLPAVHGQAVRIQQVFQNLLSNAIRYMDKPQGRIRVSCRGERGGYWQFSVADNGPGIEARHQERIFLLFQTLVPRDRSESTGIGLSLVKKIVEGYGGRVWVESTPGLGSTFHFTLPKAGRAQRGHYETDALSDSAG